MLDHFKDRVCRFDALLSKVGISPELSIHFMKVIHQIYSQYEFTFDVTAASDVSGSSSMNVRLTK